jgi:hypothetical protein
MSTGIRLLPPKARPQFLGEIDGFLVIIHAVELILNQTFSRFT